MRLVYRTVAVSITLIANLHIGEAVADTTDLPKITPCELAFEKEKCAQGRDVSTYSRLEFDGGKIYWGQVVDGAPNGHGVFKSAQGVLYEGKFTDGKREGYGILIFNLDDPQSERYEGFWKGDRRHGFGRQILKNKHQYHGDYKDGKKAGKGKYLDEGGKVYYEGDIAEDGVVEGIGTWYYKSGEKYVGAFKAERRHGFGKYFDKNNRLRYEGNFLEGFASGEGVLFYEDGTKYVGNFKNDKPNGNGVLYEANGKIKSKGLWENGENVAERNARLAVERKRQKTCDNEITRKYDWTHTDKYGSRFGSVIDTLEYRTVLGPGAHKYGNNKALLYAAVVDTLDGGRISKRDTFLIWCIFNTKDEFLGIERSFD